jgi:hypothetical protein
MLLLLKKVHPSFWHLSPIAATFTEHGKQLLLCIALKGAVLIPI